MVTNAVHDRAALKRQIQIEYLRSEVDHYHRMREYSAAASRSESLATLLNNGGKSREAQQAQVRTAELFILAASMQEKDELMTGIYFRKAVETLMNVGLRERAKTVAEIGVAAYFVRYQAALTLSKVTSGGYSSTYDLDALSSLSIAVEIANASGDKDITQKLLQELLKKLNEGRDRNLKYPTSDVAVRYVRKKVEIARKLKMKELEAEFLEEDKRLYRRYRDAERRELKRRE